MIVSSSSSSVVTPPRFKSQHAYTISPLLRLERSQQHACFTETAARHKVVRWAVAHAADSAHNNPTTSTRSSATSAVGHDSASAVCPVTITTILASIVVAHACCRQPLFPRAMFLLPHRNTGTHDTRYSIIVTTRFAILLVLLHLFFFVFVLHASSRLTALVNGAHLCGVAGRAADSAAAPAHDCKGETVRTTVATTRHFFVRR
mmetsp:Transcript_25846/g.51905  ORF Transcript_25846/g.51905 Transcript_25846/m.51905 type:complete len:204 (-) Transcript_25846:245-856(-)